MTALVTHPLAAELTLVMALLWGCLASLVPFLRAHRRMASWWGVVALGVPVLGLLTYVNGPLVGVTGFALGILMLNYSPLLRLARRRRNQSGMTRPPVSPAE